MRDDSIPLEEIRLEGVEGLEDFNAFHERHRVFPMVFEHRDHHKIIDLSAGIGVAAKRIQDNYPCELICNDISPTSLKVLASLKLKTVSFDLDNDNEKFPFPDGHFDAVISLATIEHLIYTDHFLKEINRILSDTGYLYLSTPNYAAASFIPEFIAGRSFHNPLSKDQKSRYEFFAHVRYFTYRTLLEYVSTFNFIPEAVYLPLPAGSSRYKALYKKSKIKAITYRYAMSLMYWALSPRWASEPIVCFKKGENNQPIHPRKIVL